MAKIATAKDIENETRRAQEALEVARRALKDGFCDDAANRLYYAAFHAARVHLWKENPNLQPRTHAGVITLYGRELVRTGKAPEEFGRALSELSKSRERADYGGGGVSCGLLTEKMKTVEKMVRRLR